MLDGAKKGVLEVITAWGWSAGAIADCAIAADRMNGTDKALSGDLKDEVVAAVGEGLLRDDEAMWRAAEAFAAVSTEAFDMQDLRDHVEEAMAAAFGVDREEVVVGG